MAAAMEKRLEEPGQNYNGDAVLLAAALAEVRMEACAGTKKGDPWHDEAAHWQVGFETRALFEPGRTRGGAGWRRRRDC